METKRLISLDAFRGFTIAAMILVNYPGSWSHVFQPLLHAKWNGLTPTDLIFPFFLFIVGVSISLAYTKRLSKGIKPKQLYVKIFTRTLKIFAVGLILNFIHTWSLEDLRIAGVLQRISLVFLVCSLLFLHTNWIKQLIVGVVLLLGYWLTMCFIPIPGQESALLEPGTNLSAWIDSFILPGKLYFGSWDPEGLYSTLPAIASGISGLLVGKLVQSQISVETKVIRLFSIGFAVFAIGFIWGYSFPINKSLWTSTYVLVTSGLAMMTLGVSIYMVDVLKRDKFARIGVIFGANAITVYVLADVLSIVFYGINIGDQTISQHFMELFMGFAPKLGSMIFALLFTSLNFIPAYILYQKKIFIKL